RSYLDSAHLSHLSRAAPGARMSHPLSNSHFDVQRSMLDVRSLGGSSFPALSWPSPSSIIHSHCFILHHPILTRGVGQRRSNPKKYGRTDQTANLQILAEKQRLPLHFFDLQNERIYSPPLLSLPPRSSITPITPVTTRKVNHASFEANGRSSHLVHHRIPASNRCRVLRSGRSQPHRQPLEP